MGASDVAEAARPRWKRWLYGLVGTAMGLIALVIGVGSITLVGFAGVGLIAGDDCPPGEMCEGLGDAIVGAAFMVGLLGLLVTAFFAAGAYSAWWALRNGPSNGSTVPAAIDPAATVDG